MRRKWGIEEGYFVCVTIHVEPITFLVDTGLNVTILSKTVADRLPSNACFLSDLKYKNAHFYRGGNSFSVQDRNSVRNWSKSETGIVNCKY